MSDVRRWQVSSEADRLVCAADARRHLLSLGVSRALALRAELCVAELAGNAARHAGGGEVEVATTADAIEIHVWDRGPGIEDVGLALEDGVSRGRRRSPEDPARELVGMGTGLGAVSRSADLVQLTAREGGGLHAFAALHVRTDDLSKGTRKTA
ncbi:MAG: ATP-binding protein [Sandaracinus sp.]